MVLGNMLHCDSIMGYHILWKGYEIQNGYVWSEAQRLEEAHPGLSKMASQAWSIWLQEQE